LRQDPDVIFIAEIRDEETAQMALRAAMTGHLVLATLHTNDSFGVPARLIDLGLQPILLAGNLLCAVAQRLVRRLCQECRIPIKVDNAMKQRYGFFDQGTIYTAKGCDACGNTGYKGRLALVEILRFNDDLDARITQGGSRPLLRQGAQDMHTLAQDGLEKVLMGQTSLFELDRVIGHYGV
jgi:type II secretory ATPase GspE/PulE/Tfp pilus assembly ATPase PilB-like protein